MSTTSDGLIPDRLYRKDEVRRQLRWSERMWQGAMKSGLREHVRPVGRQSYVLGKDIIGWWMNRPPRKERAKRSESNSNPATA